ncbi:MAG: ATP-binding protein [Candidatus Electrothrix sp. AX5]|nr:ATP-binding protein [Candidatus Electrothrix sp. AX5]
MLSAAHQGYIYQDIIGAYFVAQELACGKGATKFHFDFKKTPKGVPDKFDDLVIYREETTFIQIKYSNGENQHVLTKNDFSASGSYDLALFDLFETWKALHSPGSAWRICLAWDKPLHDDKIQTVLVQLPDNKSFLPGTTCYQFNCDSLWPEHGEVLSSWRTLKNWSKSNNRTEFKAFLDSLVLEVNCPKSSLLKDYSQGLEKLLARTIERIGIGIYPNDHLMVPQVTESLCTIAARRRATNDSIPISCDDIAQQINVIQEYGGVEQKFTIDENVLIVTPDRVDQVVSVLKEHRTVILTAEPGAGKSWLIENLQNHLRETTHIIKHYCYIALEDPLALKRITVNVLYGSLITQIIQNDEELEYHLTKRYASNLEQLNILLGNITKKTLLIIDGIDHIWRVYQKNRGGLTKDETQILQALAQLDSSNSNVSLLIVSQPINQLAELTTFYHCTLDQLPESFVEKLLEKQAVPNTKVEEVSLAEVIHEKSKGNALYCKYLIDHAVNNKTYTSFEWIAALPAYEFNLTGYYQYLYEQIQGDTRVPYALCGADFSITEPELQDITHMGNLVSAQLTSLKPILRYNPAVGHSIYHESFKRFVVDTIKDQGASIDYLIYRPLISWLKTHSFFESTKAYGHLLKLYYEVDAYDAIAQTISEDFLDNSLYNAQPFHRIRQNHHLQKASLRNIDGFSPIIIVTEQSKIIYEIENITDQVLIKYLKAVQKIHGEEAMYRVLRDDEHLLVDTKDALRFLVDQAYQGKEVVHWSIVPRPSSISDEILGLVCVKFLHTNQYEKFDNLIKSIHEDHEHRNAFAVIYNEIEWWCIHVGEDWIENTPYFKGILDTLTSSVSTLEQAVERIISTKNFDLHDDWEVMLRDVVMLTKTTSKDEVKEAIHTLSEHNWFRNWLIYLIKITGFLQRGYNNEELVEAFSYLVRDLEPFKGKPRVCDLYTQLPFIKKSFHQGLQLCNGNEELLIQCCELLEKVTNLTTSIERSFTGPLTNEEYLELITSYLPEEYVINKYKEYYDLLGSRRVYPDVAKTAFEYAHVLSRLGKKGEAKEKYLEGTQALSAYGSRNDRTFSEVLDCCVPYQQAYGTLEVKWFFELYQMTTTVVTHTDGKSTSRYPIEWFQEFIKVYPDAALRFLISETLESTEANWYQEDEFYHILKEYGSLFSPTQWFLLCRSLPLGTSSEIIAHGLTILDQIDDSLQDVYRRWLQSLPEKETAYSQEIVFLFEQQFGVSLKSKEDSSTAKEGSYTEVPAPSALFSASSVDEALAFLETNSLTEEHAIHLQQLLASITHWEEKKKILRQVAKSFTSGRDAGEWVEDFFEPESRDWLYFNVCLFVFLTDGWYHGLHYTHYLKRAYEVNPDKTIITLKEILVSSEGCNSLISCNLIKALSELQVEEVKVQELLQTTFKIVKRRLPHPPNSEINTSTYQSLEGFSRDEMVVALLIARLKTLTTEKTQGIIWSLIFIAQTAPKTLFRSYSWAFSHHELLLPVHRAVLLQILKEFVDQSLIPDKLIGKLIKTYPTGFFLEDQYIRSFVQYRIELDEDSARSIQCEAHQYDEDFFPYIHLKHRELAKKFRPLNGTYKAYTYKRDKIQKKHIRYQMEAEKLVTPIVSHSNALYEIVNGQYYNSLKQVTCRYQPSYTCNLRFFLEEIILQVGALTKRPSCLPTPANFPLFEVNSVFSPFEHEGWVVLASKEKELYGERFEPKKSRESSLVITCGNEPPVPGGEFYAKYFFSAHQYVNNEIDCAPRDQPICMLTIVDMLERSCIVYVSPFIIRELGLTIDPVFYKGLQTINDKGEVVIKMVTWKEDYYGDVSDGTEVPRLEGVAVMIREDYYERLLALYQRESWFVLSQEVAEE